MSTASPQSTSKPQQGESFASAMSQAMMRRLLVALAATSATAATAYLTRKGRELWHDQAAPRIEQRGGLDAVAKDIFSSASELVGSASTKVTESATKVSDSAPVAAVAEKVGGLTDSGSGAESETKPVVDISDPEREAERRERRRRREARQRALKSSGAS